VLNTILDAVIQGILLGGLYGLYAAGLSLVFGIMRLVNIAHGDFIVLAAFFVIAFQKFLSIGSPFTALLVVVPLMFIFGYVLQRFVLNQVVGDDILRPVLVTFGLSVITQNGLLQAFSAELYPARRNHRRRLSADHAGSMPCYHRRLAMDAVSHPHGGCVPRNIGRYDGGWIDGCQYPSLV
jgi:branched-subunit amino acid ABC-type transport system permease component